MQLIMYHNSSGREAFTKKLKSKEVHRAISLHPIKQHAYLYRLHNYMNGLKIEDAMLDSLKLRREVRFIEDELWKKYKININDENYIDNLELKRLSFDPSLTKFKPINETMMIPWDFTSRTLFSVAQLNPRRKLEGALKESMDDIVREVMESINKVSKERGRIIDFKDYLYGYHRVTPLYGSDYVLDLLLVYKKYRGRKMTVPVRRHSYLQRSFYKLETREITCQPGSGRLNSCDKLVYNSDLLLAGHINSRKQGRKLLDDENAEVGKIQKLRGESMDYYADLEKEYPENKLVLKQIDIQQEQEARKEYQEHKLEEKQEYPEHKEEKKEDDNHIGDDEYDDEPLHFTANEEIYFVVPLSGRNRVFERFLKNYETVCLVTNEPVHLVLILYTDPKDPQSKSFVFDLVQTMKDKYTNFKVKVIEPEGAFSRGVALERGASDCPDDALLFLVDVDMSFTTESLERIRLSTIKHKQIYFPIVFSEFDPSSVYRKSESPDHFLISESSGYWRFFGYGIVSLYRCDLKFIGGYDTSITGWGKEDVDLFDKAVKSNLTVFRSADPGLTHVFHKVECDNGLELKQREMCLNSKANTYVGQRVLAQFLNNDNDFKEFLAKPHLEGR
ncbi:hypothetical protein QYM36_008312 [Artemia franciscana]|nr:hypothetical protein QYM36_008312 [Artemia franciscana]